MDEEQEQPVSRAHVSMTTERGNSEGAVVEKKTQSQRVEVLEVEDEDARAIRLQSIFEKLNSGSSSSSETTGSGMPYPSFNFEERKTWAVDPPSELLSRVQAFLPQIEASNTILTQRAETDPQSVDMEQLEDDSERYIEMNLGLGVFDMEPQEQDTEMTDSSMSSSSSSSSSTSPSSSDSDSDSDSSDSESELDSEEILSSCIPSNFLSRSSSSTSQLSTSQSSDNIGLNGKMKAPRLMRPLPKRSGSSASQPKPSIVVLNASSDDSSME
ncbi:hypothetical protein F5890DRAFT_1475593 [Lentinula detonsa]|uniref:Uncharacterized protein n=1 Tax=Lentinula detonsa TaxID=2804962 RepID=A0AA38UQL8_9AGAR|nr:hypothetical protein F5890DRAFT_1475593 [Lentinula detonsa]